MVSGDGNPVTEAWCIVAGKCPFRLFERPCTLCRNGFCDRDEWLFLARDRPCLDFRELSIDSHGIKAVDGRELRA